ncbi:putative membrane protein [[Clostridium] sordellii ATCC 9714]|nr:putative membrane protein [[Clostridium] sordellii ATCC 9714] [Paeniclostridium sordellii ATCC 9714]
MKNNKKELAKSVIDLTLALIKFIGAIALVVLALKYLFS